jgi:hypothetical protein
MLHNTPHRLPFLYIILLFIRLFIHLIYLHIHSFADRLCGLVVRLPDCRHRGQGFDSRRYKLFCVVVGLEWGPLSLVRINEELLQRKVAAPVYKTEINDRGGSVAMTMPHPSICKSWH